MAMVPYANLGGNSGVVAYEAGYTLVRGISFGGGGSAGQEAYIIVQFKSGAQTFYEYTASSCGGHNVAQMVALAKAGQGLNSFIMLTPAVKHGYSRKW